MPKYIETTNPATGEKLESYELQSVEQARSVVDLARRTFKEEWRTLPISKRADHFRSLVKVLRSAKTTYATQMTLEMGKPISQATSEVEKCAQSAEVFADKAEEWLADEKVETDAKTSFVAFEPLGVIFSIMPWNFPFSQVFRFSIPSIIAGNTTVLKHSQVCTGSALTIQQIFEQSGFPRGVFNTLVIDHETVSSLIDYEGISGISLTGSVEVGQRIASVAGRNMKKCVLELGGSDAFIVLDDADIPLAAKGAADSRLLNSGQSCINGKRFIVVKEVAKEFTERFVGEFERKRIGDPLKEDTDIGPLATTNQVDILEEQVGDAVLKHGRIETGGRRLDSPGSFYLPTIVSNASEEMKVMIEEVFGPVAPIYVAENERDAITIGNSSEFGLGTSLYTRDHSRALRLAKSIDAGMVTINAPVRSDPRMPFGGIKKSGIGRESSKYGLREFVNIKSVRAY
ncbi:MAG: NAD-dependent succinate-semialdehyde dehydrogenase [Nitrososphaerales archaeon]